MRRAFLFLASVIALHAVDPQARNVKMVYILGMTAGLDQYLASELSKAGFYSVTTDPLKADAIFTDFIGPTLEAKLTKIYAPPPPPPKKEDSKKEEGSSNVTEPPQERVGRSSWGRGKGTVFLVDRKTGTVLWSMNRLPKNTSAKEMTEHAEKIVERLQKDLAVPKTAQPSQ